jgi:hypothetical protein
MVRDEGHKHFNNGGDPDMVEVPAVGKIFGSVVLSGVILCSGLVFASGAAHRLT